MLRAIGVSGRVGVEGIVSYLEDGHWGGPTGREKSLGQYTPRPDPVVNLHLDTVNGGQELLLTWDDAANADDYLVFTDTMPNGTFSTVAAIATSGTSGVTLAMQSGETYYL